MRNCLASLYVFSFIIFPLLALGWKGKVHLPLITGLLYYLSDHGHVINYYIYNAIRTDMDFPLKINIVGDDGLRQFAYTDKRQIYFSLIWANSVWTISYFFYFSSEMLVENLQ